MTPVLPVISFILAAGVGALAGGLTAVLVCSRTRRRSRRDYRLVAPPIDPELEQRIAAAATAWARAHDRPEAADVVANKLRLLARFHRHPRGNRRWSA